MIYVIKHKPYRVPELPVGYRVLCAGGYSESGALDSSTGDNIDRLNLKLSEDTAMYWVWKNTDEPLVGIAHYHNFLADDHNNILTMEMIEALLAESDMLAFEYTLPFTVRTNVIQSGMGEGGLSIVERYLPEGYRGAFDEVMAARRYRIKNLMITSREIFNAYCEWLFSFAIDAADEYQAPPNAQWQQMRALSYVTEALLSVWIKYNKVKVRDVNALMMPYER